MRGLKKSKNSSAKPYIKMDKSSSVKVEIRSRKARKLIDKTLKAADHPGKRLAMCFDLENESEPLIIVHPTVLIAFNF
ncbi:hypothetical protein V6N13_018633 [Hibiscus sabdariffa]